MILTRRPIHPVWSFNLYCIKTISKKNAEKKMMLLEDKREHFYQRFT